MDRGKAQNVGMNIVYTILIWNKRSEDYNKTPWHRIHGTENRVSQTEKDAIEMVQQLRSNPRITKVVVCEPNGYKRTWSDEADMKTHYIDLEPCEDDDLEF